MWGCFGLAVMLCVGVCILTVVLTPIAFRLLPASVQERVVARLPFLAALQEPTPDLSAYETLPTIDSTRAAAAARLDPQSGGNPTPVLGYAPLGATMTPHQFIVGGGGEIVTLAPRPTATSEPLPAQFHIGLVEREAQLWNNCGPANLVQAYRVLGVQQKQTESQTQVASWLKPNRNDANVSPWQLVAYTQQFTEMRAVARVNGNLHLLKRLVYAGFGVIIETGLYAPEDGSWEGHYITVVGWDDPGGVMYGLDTFIKNPDARGVREQYADLDERWKHFNRVFIVVYYPRDEARVRDILGTAWDTTQNAQEALNVALTEAQRNPNDVYAWFNAGSSFVLLGQWQQAAAHYDRARVTGRGLPWRMLWYQFGPYVAYYNVGDYRTVIDLATAVHNRVKYIEETYYYRGLAYAALGDLAQANTDLQYAARFNPNFAPAQTALQVLASGNSPMPEVL